MRVLHDSATVRCPRCRVTIRLCLSGHHSAQEKYSIFLRHRYSSCVEMLLQLLDERHRVAVGETAWSHSLAQPAAFREAAVGTGAGCDGTCCPRVWLQEAGLCALMQLAAAEGKHPLLELDWSEHHSFPRELVLVGQPPRPRPGPLGLTPAAAPPARRWWTSFCPGAWTPPC